MDKTFLEFILNLIILVPAISLLIVISLRLSKKSLDRFALDSYAQVVERITLNKDTNLYLIKLGSTGCVLVCSNNNTQLIKELDEYEMEEIMKIKKEKNNLITLKNISGLNLNNILNNKFTREKNNGYNKSDFK